MSEDNQLDLRIVGGNEFTAVCCVECLADFAAFFSSDRNILQVWIAARKSPRRGSRLNKTGMYPPVCISEQGQRIGIARFQFRGGAVIENFCRKLINGGKLLKHGNIRRVACLCFFTGRQLPFGEQHFLQLLRGGDVKRMADQLVNFRFVPCKRIRQFFRKCG